MMQRAVGTRHPSGPEAGGRRLIGLLAALFAAFTTSVAMGQEAPTKARLRVQQITATPSVVSATHGTGAQTLQQILEAADAQLLNAVEQTRKFEMVPRDVNAVIREQDFATSGNVSRLDPQAARPLQMAGVKYVAIVTVDNFQDITQRMQLEGGLGKTNAERRTVQIQAVVQIVDATKATVLRSTNVKFESSTTSETLDAASVDGRATNAITGAVALELATRAANEITDVIYPAKVVGYTMGTITFNRTKGSGVEPGQYWEIFAAGPNMVDPDTGEVLGAEEVSIGFCVVSDAGDKVSKAAAIIDNGIDRGSILRKRASLPAGIDPNMRARGSAGAGTPAPAPAPTPVPSAPLVPTPAPSSGGGLSVPTPLPASTPSVAAPAVSTGTIAKPSRLAIFVKNRAKSIPDERVMLLEDQIAATATDAAIEVIRREDVSNAVARFATAGANAGTNLPDSQTVDRLLSDRSSSVALAQMLGADGLIVASISAMDRETAAYNDGTHASTVESYVLRCTYSILDGTTGGSLAAGSADSTTAIRQTANLRIVADPTNDLLSDTGRQIGVSVRGHFASGTMRQPSSVAQEIDVQVNTFLAEMRVPRLKRSPEGDYSLAAETVEVGVFNAEVLVDGVSVGAAPATLRVRPGLHKLRVQRPLCEPEDRMVNFRAGMSLQIPLRLSAEGRSQWIENAKLFDILKTNEVMRDAELTKAKAFAEFLKNSGFKVNLDTSGWKALVN